MKIAKKDNGLIGTTEWKILMEMFSIVDIHQIQKKKKQTICW